MDLRNQILSKQVIEIRVIDEEGEDYLYPADIFSSNG